MMGLKGGGRESPGESTVAERGVASMARARALQSRLSSALAMLLCGGLGVGLLAWYYGGVLAHHRATTSGRPNPATAARADNPLPPLGSLRDLQESPASDPVPQAPALPQPTSMPELPPLAQSAPAAMHGPAVPSVHQSALERRLAGPAFAQVPGLTATLPPSPGVPVEGAPGAASGSAPAERTTGLADLLTPTALAAASARELPTQRLLLAKGAFIDCTLETAIDSSLPGMTTCITATDTFSVDGKVVLLERGSKLVGETRGQVQQGSARLFVLWTEARTPGGIVVPLASPGTDALGRSGLDGEVDRHFWQRFGSAILISMVDTAAQTAQSSVGTGTVIYDTSSSQGVATEALRGTLGIGPTVTKHQGDRIQILVARDLDFRQVYQLRESEPVHQ